MTILFNLASRSRPERFFETLSNLIDMTVSEDYFIVAKLDIDDPTMNNEEVKLKLSWMPKVIVKWGTSTSKIHAINRDLNDGDLPNWDILINMSDDMRWGTYGFDDIIRKAMPESLDAFVHVPDDYAKDRVCTTSIIGYRYYQRDMTVYYNGYYSMWSDDEETEKAKRRGCYIFLPDVISLEHLHYTNNRKAVKDELYWRNDTYNADKEIFEQRKARNFDL
jgi:hypothetical protein